LPGDANGDRNVNDLDLFLVWQNLLLPPANRDLQLDLNNDGAVTVADVDVVRANYRAALPQAAPAAAPATLSANLNDDALVADPSAEGSLGADSLGSELADEGTPENLPSSTNLPAQFVPGYLFELRASGERFNAARSEVAAAEEFLDLQSSSVSVWQSGGDTHRHSCFTDGLSAFNSGLRTWQIRFDTTSFSPAPLAVGKVELSSRSLVDSTISKERQSQLAYPYVART